MKTTILLILLSTVCFSQELPLRVNFLAEYICMNYQIHDSRITVKKDLGTRTYSWKIPLAKEAELRLDLGKTFQQVLTEKERITYRDCDENLVVTTTHTNYDVNNIYVTMTWYSPETRKQVGQLMFCKQ
jgi:hypothetical protein